MFQQSYVFVDEVLGEGPVHTCYDAEQWADFMAVWGDTLGGIDSEGALYFYI